MKPRTKESLERELKLYENVAAAFIAHDKKTEVKIAEQHGTISSVVTRLVQRGYLLAALAAKDISEEDQKTYYGQLEENDRFFENLSLDRRAEIEDYFEKAEENIARTKTWQGLYMAFAATENLAASKEAEKFINTKELLENKRKEIKKAKKDYAHLRDVFKNRYPEIKPENFNEKIEESKNLQKSLKDRANALRLEHAAIQVPNASVENSKKIKENNKEIKALEEKKKQYEEVLRNMQKTSEYKDYTVEGQAERDKKKQELEKQIEKAIEERISIYKKAGPEMKELIEWKVAMNDSNGKILDIEEQLAKEVENNGEEAKNIQVGSLSLQKRKELNIDELLISLHFVDKEMLDKMSLAELKDAVAEKRDKQHKKYNQLEKYRLINIFYDKYKNILTALEEKDPLNSKYKLSKLCSIYKDKGILDDFGKDLARLEWHHGFRSQEEMQQLSGEEFLEVFEKESEKLYDAILEKNQEEEKKRTPDEQEQLRIFKGKNDEIDNLIAEIDEIDRTSEDLSLDKLNKLARNFDYYDLIPNDIEGRADDFIKNKINELNASIKGKQEDNVKLGPDPKLLAEIKQKKTKLWEEYKQASDKAATVERERLAVITDKNLAVKNYKKYKEIIDKLDEIPKLENRSVYEKTQNQAGKLFAKQKLFAEGHSNSKEFSRMMKSLQIVKEWDSGKRGELTEGMKKPPQSFEQALTQLKESSIAYQNAKNDQWRPNPTTLRLMRLDLAKAIEEFADAAKENTAAAAMEQSEMDSWNQYIETKGKSKIIEITKEEKINELSQLDIEDDFGAEEKEV